MSARSRRIARVAAGRLVRALWHSGFGLTGLRGSRAAFAQQARLACEDLGPAFIKIGQLISIRPDLFSPELVFEMEKLQDSVGDVPFEQIERTIRAEFGRELADLFESIEPEPVASASIAQVHTARLKEGCLPVWGKPMAAGTEVAVKVVKPGVVNLIEQDLRLARRWARRLSSFGVGRHLDVEAFLGEFEHSLRSEVDLRNEGRVADRFSFDFRHDPVVRVPRIVWTRSTRRVLTMERIEGWRLSDLTEAERAGIDGYSLAVHGAEVFMRQVLVHGRYHADLHPANLFITPEGEICYLDFGIVGRTRPEDRVAIAQVLAATVYRDADRAIKYSRRLGLEIDPGIEQRLRDDVAALLDRTMGGRDEPADVRSFAIGYLRLLAKYRIPIPEGYGMLIKALVTVEGVARALYPGIDIAQAARPFATRLIAREMLAPARLAERMPEAMAAALRVLSA